MSSNIREASNFGLDTQWRVTHRAWDTYWEAERTLNAIPRTAEAKDEREQAITRWYWARARYRNEYRILKRLMRVAIQYKRL